MPRLSHCCLSSSQLCLRQQITYSPGIMKTYKLTSARSVHKDQLVFRGSKFYCLLLFSMSLESAAPEQQKLKTACAPAQADLSFCCLHMEMYRLCCPLAHNSIFFPVIKGSAEKRQFVVCLCRLVLSTGVY